MVKQRLVTFCRFLPAHQLGLDARDGTLNIPESQKEPHGYMNFGEALHSISI
jgi:hypothetical protein